MLAASAAYVHFRGNLSHPFGRQLSDHSTFLAPFNVLIYLFSRVPARAFLEPCDFPELDRLTATRIPTAINRFVINHMLKATSIQNHPGEPIGIANRLFAGVYQIRLLGKRIKKWNRKVYYIGKYALVAGIAAWLLI